MRGIQTVTGCRKRLQAKNVRMEVPLRDLEELRWMLLPTFRLASLSSPAGTTLCDQEIFDLDGQIYRPSDKVFKAIQ
jgi:hypothetical protein